MQQHLEIMEKNINESVNIFHQNIQHGCVFVCSACHQTNFEDNVLPVQNLHLSVHSDLLKAYFTGYLSENAMEFLCLPCKNAIHKGTIPKLSIKKQMWTSCAS